MFINVNQNVITRLSFGNGDVYRSLKEVQNDLEEKPNIKVSFTSMLQLEQRHCPKTAVHFCSYAFT